MDVLPFVASLFTEDLYCMCQPTVVGESEHFLLKFFFESLFFFLFEVDKLEDWWILY